jgi:hypothetical protein
VEFLVYSDAVDELKKGGVVAVEEGDFVHFRLEKTAKIVTETREALLGTDLAGAGEDVRTAEVPNERLPELLEGIIHRNHMTEALLVPVGKWKNIVDLLAFELAEDETWQEIDTQAALNLNTRNPMILGPEDMHIVKPMLEGLLKTGESPESDLTIMAVGAPLVFEFRCSGQVHAWCPNAAVVDEIIATV